MAKFYTNSKFTHKQKATICQIAKQAYDQQDKHGLVDDLKFPDWRRQEQINAIGIDSLTKATQNHYADLKGHFLHLAGLDDKAFNSYMKADTDKNNSTQSFWHLEQVAEKIGAILVSAGRAETKGSGKAYILAAGRRILAKPRLTWEAIKDLDADTISKLVVNANRNLKALRLKHGE